MPGAATPRQVIIGAVRAPCCVHRAVRARRLLVRVVCRQVTVVYAVVAIVSPLLGTYLDFTPHRKAAWTCLWLTGVVFTVGMAVLSNRFVWVVGLLLACLTQVNQPDARRARSLCQRRRVATAASRLECAPPRPNVVLPLRCSLRAHFQPPSPLPPSPLPPSPLPPSPLRPLPLPLSSRRLHLLAFSSSSVGGALWRGLAPYAQLVTELVTIPRAAYLTLVASDDATRLQLGGMRQVLSFASQLLFVLVMVVIAAGIRARTEPATLPPPPLPPPPPPPPPPLPPLLPRPRLPALRRPRPCTCLHPVAPAGLAGARFVGILAALIAALWYGVFMPISLSRLPAVGASRGWPKGRVCAAESSNPALVDRLGLAPGTTSRDLSHVPAAAVLCGGSGASSHSHSASSLLSTSTIPTPCGGAALQTYDRRPLLCPANAPFDLPLI